MEKDFKFRYYPTEELLISRIDKKLNQYERKVRRYLMNYTINNGKAFNLCEITDEMSKDIGFEKEELKVLFDNLDNKSSIVVDENKNVNFIYPVSAIPTNHKVTLADGRSFSAMCAIDAMGTAFTFNQDVKIKSVCSNCGDSIYVEIKDGQLIEYTPEEMHILHVDLNKNKNWSGEC